MDPEETAGRYKGMKKSGVKNDFIMPIVVLTVICIVISAALGFTNKVTAPVIEETERRNAEAARKEVMPEADGFEEITDFATSNVMTNVIFLFC